MITTFHRLIDGLGRVLIAVGALVLAFAAFQFWGTGLAEARAQEQLDRRFSAKLAAVSTQVPETEAGFEVVESADPADPVERADSPGVGPAVPVVDRTDVPELGEPAGRIVIPVIGVDKTYVQGVRRDDLRKAPGHFPMSASPGQPGNAAIAGHRTTYGAPFLNLDKLEPGDEIIVETLQGRFTYLVNGHDDQGGGPEPLGHFIVEPTATWVLDDQGDSRLTLTACHPKRSAAQRIVVTATLESTPAAPPPVQRSESSGADAPQLAEPLNGPLTEPLTEPMDTSLDTSLDESLGWQREFWAATLLWAGLAALIALAGRLLGRRWRRSPAYALTAAPFLGCLFGCFVHLDKLLPAI